ncbi:SO1C1 protein, partial [Nesospiza acunhae]|nr:SO1C1 protein [Nesospiza acunhae]
AGCEKEPTSYMWVYILLGNMLRGIGETPITPLGISYLDDFAKEDNVPVYVQLLHWGNLCLFPSFPGSITITPQDSRWVGAWWLGFLIGGALSFLSAIPFCFLPKSLKKPEGAKKDKASHGLLENTGAMGNKLSPEKTKPRKWSAMLKGKYFYNSLKKVLGNRMYFTFLCCSLLQFSSFIGFVTYKPKYMEQQYGQSTSKSNFLIGITSLPPVGLGIFLGGFIMKKYKMGIIAATKFSFTMSFLSYAMGLLHFFVGCDNHMVAGMTVSYE